MAEDKALEAPEYRGLAVVLDGLNEPLAAYIEEAEWLVPLAYSDPALAITVLPSFEGHYHALERSMEVASNRIEAIAQTTRTAVAVARTKATLLIGLAALLTVLATFRRWRELKREVATRRTAEDESPGACRARRSHWPAKPPWNG